MRFDLSVEKLKSFQEMNDLYDHYSDLLVQDFFKEENERTCFVPELASNADGTLKNYVDLWQAHLDQIPFYAEKKAKGRKQVRANAILAISILLSVSLSIGSDFDFDQWYSNSYRWLRDRFDVARYGDSNILSMIRFQDNKRCYLFALVIPINWNNRLTGSSFINGRGDAKHLCRDYVAYIARATYLQDHPKNGSRVNHVRNYFNSLEEAYEAIPVPEKGESASHYYRRAGGSLKNVMAYAYGDLRDQCKRANRRRED